MLKPIIPLEGFNQLIESRHGYFLYNRHDTVVGKSMAEYGEYFESEVEVFRALCRPGDTVIDVGANAGSHTLALARIVGPGGFVYAFEPQRVMHQALCANMALNSIAHVDCVHAAVSDHTGFTRLPDIRYDVASNFGGVSHNQFNEGRKVPLLRLDDVVEEANVRLIKVDVEGHEWEVLKGAESIIQRARPFLYVENDRRKNSPRLIELIQSYRYKTYWHLPFFFNENNFAGNPDNIHYVGFIDMGDEMAVNGVAINMLCLPEELDINVGDGFEEVVDPLKHPLDKA